MKNEKMTAWNRETALRMVASTRKVTRTHRRGRTEAPLHPSTRFPDIQSERYDSTAFVGTYLNELCSAELE
jgi:hypothetical protein